MTITSCIHAERLLALSMTLHGRVCLDLRRQRIENPVKLLEEASTQQELLSHSDADYRSEISVLNALNARYYTPFHDDWPLRSPGVGVLRILGCIPDTLRVAIIGARKADRYGLELTRRIARRVVGEGATVLSGGALGIDIAAHRAALDAGGKTIAVLGSGLSHPAPLRHREDFLRMSGAGALISPFPCFVKAAPWTFLYRNPWLAALADIVVVVQGAKRSGALHTARCALARGVPVWVVPGGFDNPLHDGCHQLLHEGAMALRDDLDWYPSQPPEHREANALTMPSQRRQAKPEIFPETWALFDDKPRYLDDVLDPGLNKTQRVFTEVSQLELTGWLRRDVGGGFMRAWPESRKGECPSE
jgi:DNA protecting protein DprA